MEIKKILIVIVLRLLLLPTKFVNIGLQVHRKTGNRLGSIVPVSKNCNVIWSLCFSMKLMSNV